MIRNVSHRVAQTALSAFLVSLLAGTAIAQDSLSRDELMIDDFTSGRVAISLSGVSVGTTLRSQPGTMLGGWRQIGYRIRAQNGMPDTPAGYMEVIPTLGKVVANHDYNTGHRLSYRYGKGYGRDASGAVLHVDLSRFTQFEVDFEGADLNVTLYIMACTNNCDQRAQLSRNISSNQNPAAIYQGTTQVMPFADFKKREGFNWADVTHIVMFTQTSNSAFSEDFAIERFIAAAGEM